MSEYSLKIEKEVDDLPLDLKFIRSYFNISGSQTDDEINKLLKITINAAENYTQRSFCVKIWKYSHKRLKIFLPKPPVTKIISVVAKNIKKSIILEQHKDYNVDINYDGFAVLMVDKKYQGMNIEVTYEAGFTEKTLPQSILNYILNKFAELYNGHNGSMGTMSFTANHYLNPYRDMRYKL
ncbi:MAG: hypothetical protein H6845_02460 [Alphaproteobacteria bacterium]|nr:MAG: hypothetical protein H6845_02460 [Alphaproteobacteria bacterium]